MRRATGLMVVWMVVSAGVCLGSEPGRSCYRSVAQALAQETTGEVVGVGYRLEALRWDALMGRSWAQVRSCEYPERPAFTVATEAPPERARGLSPATNVAHRERPMMVAGASVRVLRAEANARMETQGVVQENGRLGDRVQVRIAGADAPSFLTGVVKGVDLVEMEP